MIHAEIIKNLEQADLVLCDLSSLNANVFFELGIRTSLNRPVALVKDKVTERIPFDLNAINTHTYDESLTPWTLSSEIEQFAEHVKAVETGTASDNDMWHYFGLTKRAAPAEIAGNPTAAKIDLLVTEVTALRNQSPVFSSSRTRHHIDTDKLRALSYISNVMPMHIGSLGEYDVYDSDDGFFIDIHATVSREDLDRIQSDIAQETGYAIAVAASRAAPD